MSRYCWILDISQPHKLPRPVTEIALFVCCIHCVYCVLYCLCGVVCCVLFEHGVLFCVICVFLCVVSYHSTAAIGQKTHLQFNSTTTTTTIIIIIIITFVIHATAPCCVSLQTISAWSGSECLWLVLQHSH
jgi:hypothetical protein